MKTIAAYASEFYDISQTRLAAVHFNQLFPPGMPVQYLGSISSLDKELWSKILNPPELYAYGISQGCSVSGAIDVIWGNGQRGMLHAGSDCAITPYFSLGEDRFPGARKISLFGDPYILTIPDETRLRPLYSSCTALRNGGHVFMFAFPCDMPVCGDRPEPKVLSSDELIRNKSIGGPLEFGWRPMLVPLDRTGKLANCFSKKRNGELCRMGMFQVDHRDIPIVIDSGGPVFRDIYRTDGSDPNSPYAVYDFDIIDADADPERMIPWVMWNGALICSRVLIGYIWSTFLVREGLAFY